MKIDTSFLTKNSVNLLAFYCFIEALKESNIPLLIQVMDWARIPTSFHSNILPAYEVLRVGGLKA